MFRFTTCLMREPSPVENSKYHFLLKSLSCPFFRSNFRVTNLPQKNQRQPLVLCSVLQLAAQGISCKKFCTPLTSSKLFRFPTSSADTSEHLHHSIKELAPAPTFSFITCHSGNQFLQKIQNFLRKKNQFWYFLRKTYRVSALRYETLSQPLVICSNLELAIQRFKTSKNFKAQLPP